MHNEILKLYEDFKLHKGELSHSDGIFTYVAPDSIHSWHTVLANGIREAKDCVALYNGGAVSKVQVEKEDLNQALASRLGHGSLLVQGEGVET